MTIEMFREQLHNDRVNRFIKLKGALLDFQALSYDYSDCGARDSDFERVAEGMIYAASCGIEPRVYTKANEWKLYRGNKSSKAAKLMAKKMSEIVGLILSFDVIDDEIMGYIKSFCSRFND